MTTNQQLFDRRIAAVPRAIGNATGVFAQRAANAELWDVEGNRYLDFAAGIAVVNTGHGHPRVLAAAREQMERFAHTAFQAIAYEPYVALAERLNVLAPFGGEAQSVFFSTGAEAVENAIKIARRATGRSAIISFTGAFHGRSLLTMSLTGKVAPYKTGFGNTVPGVHHAYFPSGEVSVAESLRSLGMLLSATVAPADVAAIIIEPIQGEGGFYQAPAHFLHALRTLCDDNGIVLIVDEIQSGFARTGRMFAIEHSGVEPDLVTVAKGIAGGYPLSGVIGRKAIMDAVPAGGLGTTFGGAPISCAAALAVLDVIEDEGLTARAQMIGARISHRIAGFAAREDLISISAPRGIGAMVAFDAMDDAGRADPMLVKRIIAKALEQGLVILSCGANGQSVRLLPPLTIAEEQLDEGLDLLERALHLGASQ